jgi:hypothetical protein
MEEKPNKVNTFWAAYYDAAVASGLPEKAAKCYVNWAQKFAISIKGKKLRSPSVKDTGGFLKGIEVQKGIEPWQVDQARKALIFLYRDFFKLKPPVRELLIYVYLTEY